MSDFLIHLSLAMSNFRALDLMQSMDLASRLFDGIDLEPLLEIPVLGLVFVPIVVALSIVALVVCAVLAVVLCVGSIIVAALCTDLTPVLAHAMAILWQLRHAFGVA